MDGTGLQLTSAPGALEWGVYQYATGGAPLLKASVDETLQSGTAVWVGLANYTRHAWEFRGPYVSGTDLPLGLDYVSPVGNFYFLVAAFDGVALLVNSATITTDVAPPAYAVSGMVLLDGSTALAGVQLTLTPGGATAMTDMAGAYSFSSVAAGSYTVTPSLAGYNFTPASKSVTVTSADVSGVDFSASAIPQTFSISGNIAGGQAGTCATGSCSGSATRTLTITY